MKDLSIEETIEILKKAFISSTNVKEEDLELYMENSNKVDSEIIYQLLLLAQEKLEEEQIHRLIRLLPTKHKSYLEVFLPIGALLSEEKEKLYSIYRQSEIEKKEKQRYANR